MFQDPSRPAIPALLAVGAVHHHLISNGLRLRASIVAHTAQCFSTHHFACLVGYGASAVCAYGALESCRQWRASEKTGKLMAFGKLPSVSMEQAQYNFRKVSGREGGWGASVRALCRLSPVGTEYMWRNATGNLTGH